MNISSEKISCRRKKRQNSRTKAPWHPFQVGFRGRQSPPAEIDWQEVTWGKEFQIPILLHYPDLEVAGEVKVTKRPAQGSGFSGSIAAIGAKVSPKRLEGFLYIFSRTQNQSVGEISDA